MIFSPLARAIILATAGSLLISNAFCGHSDTQLLLVRKSTGKAEDNYGDIGVTAKAKPNADVVVH